MTLLVVSVWLRRAGRPMVYTFVPMLIVAAATLMAMVSEVRGHVAGGNWLLAATGAAILVLDVWVLLEGLVVLFGRPRGRAALS